MSPAHRPDQHPDVAHSPEPSAQSTTRPASPAYPAGSSTTAALVVTALLVLTQLYAAIPLLTPISADLHGNATVALSTAFSLTYAAGFLIWGPVSDHYGRRRTMALALGILTVSTGCCALAPSLPALAALRAIQGLSASGFAPVALAYLSEALAPPRRAGAIGAMSTSFLVAGIVGQVLASLVALHLGWRWFFPLCGGLLAVALATVLAVVHDAAHASGPSGSSLRGQFASLGRLALRPAVLALSLAHVTLLMVFVAMYTGIGGHLESLGMRPSTIILIRLAALPAMFLSLGAGRFAARRSWAQIARLGFGVSALGMLGEALLAGSLVGLVACSVAYVAGVALAAPAMISLYGQVSAPNRGSGMALNGFILFVGTSAGPLLATSSPTFRALALALTGILVLALAAVTVFKALADADH
ncbi:MFS transporter [Actinomyces naeslundii]|uniref:MFS transporter n=1 Tax=Actinomyces naeslundii TaxID=1655 RepID=A0ABX3F177_ACTNA|nr:MFS transporter [Actinomyces naeslundii]OLO84253.1 MFS transporter [Actinomyces naeslundii]